MDDTCFPDACNMHCVETVKITRTHRWSTSAASWHFDNSSISLCLWTRINVRSFFLSTFFRIMLQATSAFSVAVRKSSTDDPAKDLARAARADRYSSAGGKEFSNSIAALAVRLFGSLTAFLLDFRSLVRR